MRDSRRTETDAASCSTAVVGEEPALRPATSRAVRSAARSLTDGEQSLTAESALSAEIESVDTDSDLAGVANLAEALMTDEPAVPPPFLFGKPTKRAPSGQSPTGVDAEGAEGSAQDGLDASGDPHERYMDVECDSGTYPADPDFNALLEDIATGPLHGSAPADASKPPAAPAVEAAEAGSEAAAAATAQRKKPKPNPLRGFLSRRLQLVPQAPAAAEPTPTPEPTAVEEPPAAQPQPPVPPPALRRVLQLVAPDPEEEQPADQGSARDENEQAAEQEEKDLSQEEKQQQKEDSQEVLGMAMGWLQGMYLEGARECLPANAAFERIAALLPGALLVC